MTMGYYRCMVCRYVAGCRGGRIEEGSQGDYGDQASLSGVEPSPSANLCPPAIRLPCASLPILRTRERRPRDPSSYTRHPPASWYELPFLHPQSQQRTGRAVSRASPRRAGATEVQARQSESSLIRPHSKHARHYQAPALQNPQPRAPPAASHSLAASALSTTLVTPTAQHRPVLFDIPRRSFDLLLAGP
jgi:hypothetical protein